MTPSRAGARSAVPASALPRSRTGIELGLLHIAFDLSVTGASGPVQNALRAMARAGPGQGNPLASHPFPDPVLSSGATRQRVRIMPPGRVRLTGITLPAAAPGPTFVDATEGGKRLRRGARLWTVAVSTFKAET